MLDQNSAPFLTPRWLAVGVGFEPTVRKRTTVFEFDEYRPILCDFVLKALVLFVLRRIAIPGCVSLYGPVPSRSLAIWFAETPPTPLFENTPPPSMVVVPGWTRRN